MDKTQWTLYLNTIEYNDLYFIQSVLEQVTPDPRMIKIEPVQGISDQNDNHLFALAYAITLCRNEHPENIIFLGNAMRSQFKKLLMDEFVSDEFRGLGLNIEPRKKLKFLDQKQTGTG